jgi:hypothetical protein
LDNFTLDEENATMPEGSYSQTSSALVLDGAFSTGNDSLGGLFSSSYNWTNAPAFGLTMSVINPGSSFTFFVELYDDLLGFISTYEGTTFGVGSTPTLVTMDFVSFEPGRGQDDLSSVDGLQFTWGTEGSINASIQEISVVPEPSTWVLIGLAAAVLGGRVIVKRRR